MLDLVSQPDSKGYARKLRLFACACVRRQVGYILQHEWDRTVVEVAERFADGEVSDTELALAERNARSHPVAGPSGTLPDRVLRKTPSWLAREAAMHTAYPGPVYCATHTAGTVLDAINALQPREAGLAHQADLLRCIFGPLPFRSPPPLDPLWIDGNAGIVKMLAEVIYRERRWQDLPILADALEDAGCTHEELIAHLRAPLPHVRGCWPVDLLLAKGR
jgi:hypothetical protein